MIRSSKVSLKFANVNRQNSLSVFLDEYRRVIRLFVDILWDEKNVPCLLSKTFTSQINSWLTARMIQCAGKQASAIVRGTRKKHSQRVWRLENLKAEGHDFSKLEKTLEREVVATD
jgi:hypothetical protein